MKIGPIDKKNITQTDSSKSVDKADKSDFGKHLDNAIKTSENITGVKKTNSLNPLDIMPVNQVTPTYNVTDQKTINQQINGLEKVLSSLDLYQNALSNPDINYSQMEGLITEINAGKDTLVSSLNSIPEGDSIKNIIKETAILVLDITNNYHTLKGFE